MSELTAKQKRFVDEYCIDLNATQAAIRAGYSKNGADVQGVRLLGNASVAAEIEAKRKRLEVKTEMTAEWVLKKYKELIENNLQVDPAVAKSALDSVGKHLGMFTDKVKLEGTLTVEKLLEAI